MAKINPKLLALFRRAKKPQLNSNPVAATIAITIRIGQGNIPTNVATNENKESNEKKYIDLSWRPSPS